MPQILLVPLCLIAFADVCRAIEYESDDGTKVTCLRAPTSCWRCAKGRIYEWDKRHGTVEVYERPTRHRGVRSGERQTASANRPAQKGRTMKEALEEDLARGFVLQGFDRATDELRIELDRKAAPIERLRWLFDIREDFGMCDAYPVDAARADTLAPLDPVSEPIDMDKYDFFLQRYA
jgi:hypothetical protein